MKKSIILFCAILVAAFSVSCSDDDNTPVPEPAQAELVGNWQIDTVKITNFVDGGFPAPDACMISYVSGYEFNADNSVKVALVAGLPFSEMSNPDYWEWSGDITDFTITQLNQAMPPYNFGIAPTNVKVEAIDDTWEMTFSAELANGTTADFVLTKTEVIDNSQKTTVVNADGSAYECNPFGGQ